MPVFCVVEWLQFLHNEAQLVHPHLEICVNCVMKQEQYVRTMRQPTKEFIASIGLMNIDQPNVVAQFSPELDSLSTPAKVNELTKWCLRVLPDQIDCALKKAHPNLLNQRYHISNTFSVNSRHYRNSHYV